MVKGQQNVELSLVRRLFHGTVSCSSKRWVQVYCAPCLRRSHPLHCLPSLNDFDTFQYYAQMRCNFILLVSLKPRWDGTSVTAATVLPLWWTFKFQRDEMLRGHGTGFNTDNLDQCKMHYFWNGTCSEIKVGWHVQIYGAPDGYCPKHHTEKVAGDKYDFRVSTYGTQMYRSPHSCFPVAAHREFHFEIVDVHRMRFLCHLALLSWRANAAQPSDWRWTSRTSSAISQMIGSLILILMILISIDHVCEEVRRCECTCWIEKGGINKTFWQPWHQNNLRLPDADCKWLISC